MRSFSASVTRGGNLKRIPVVLSIKQMLISFEVPPWPAARVRGGLCTLLSLSRSLCQAAARLVHLEFDAF